MADVDVVDFFSSSDVLSRTHMKPWWETLRLYFWSVMPIISFYLMYFMDPKDSFSCVACLEVVTAGNLIQCNKTIPLTISEVAYANRVCLSEEIDWKYKNVGPLTLLATGILYAFYSSWLLVPRVVNGFDAVRRAGNKLAKLDLLSSKIEEVAVTLQTEIKDEHATIRNCCRILWIRAEQGLEIATIYLIRNVACFIILSATLGINTSLLYDTIRSPRSIICSSHYLTANGMVNFTCFYDYPSKVMLYVIVYVISASLQWLILLVAIVLMMRDKYCDDDFSPGYPRFNSTSRDNRFIRMFAKHSQDLTPATKKLLSKKAEDIIPKMQTALMQNPDTKDDDLKILGRDILLNEIDDAKYSINTQQIGAYQYSALLLQGGVAKTDEEIKIMEMHKQYILGDYKGFLEAHKTFPAFTDDCACCHHLKLELEYTDTSGRSLMYHVLADYRLHSVNTHDKVLLEHFLSRAKAGKGETLTDTEFVKQPNGDVTMEEFIFLSSLQENMEERRAEDLLSVVREYCTPQRQSSDELVFKKKKQRSGSASRKKGQGKNSQSQQQVVSGSRGASQGRRHTFTPPQTSQGEQGSKPREGETDKLLPKTK